MGVKQRYSAWVESKREDHPLVEQGWGVTLFFAADFALLGGILVVANAYFFGLAFLTCAFGEFVHANRNHAKGLPAGRHLDGERVSGWQRRPVRISSAEFLFFGLAFTSMGVLCTLNLLVFNQVNEAQLTRHFVDEVSDKGGTHHYRTVEFTTTNGRHYVVRSPRLYELAETNSEAVVLASIHLSRIEQHIVRVEVGGSEYWTLDGNVSIDEMIVLYFMGVVGLSSGWVFRRWPKLIGVQPPAHPTVAA